MIYYKIMQAIEYKIEVTIRIDSLRLNHKYINVFLSIRSI